MGRLLVATSIAVFFFFQAEDGIRDLIVTGVQTCAFFFQAEDGIRDLIVTGVQTCALPISGNPDSRNCPPPPLRCKLLLRRSLLPSSPPRKESGHSERERRSRESRCHGGPAQDRKSTRLNSSHDQISYAVFCLKKKKQSRSRAASSVPHPD